VDIHDEATFAALQRIQLFSSSIATALQTSTVIMTNTTVVSSANLTTPQSRMENILICTGENLFYLKMLPLATQITALQDVGLYEDALNLCRLSPYPTIQLRSIDTARIHERLAQSLFQKGDFEEASSHWIEARTPPDLVLSLFPDFVPLALIAPTFGNKSSTTASKPVTPKLTGTVLYRAAAAVVRFCEFHRTMVSDLVLNSAGAHLIIVTS
jgi:hypothetical protein